MGGERKKERKREGGNRERGTERERREVGRERGEREDRERVPGGGGGGRERERERETQGVVGERLHFILKSGTIRRPVGKALIII